VYNDEVPTTTTTTTTMATTPCPLTHFGPQSPVLTTLCPESTATTTLTTRFDPSHASRPLTHPFRPSTMQFDPHSTLNHLFRQPQVPNPLQPPPSQPVSTTHPPVSTPTTCLDHSPTHFSPQPPILTLNHLFQQPQVLNPPQPPPSSPVSTPRF
jgi:hypothetical protein